MSNKDISSEIEALRIEYSNVYADIKKLIQLVEEDPDESRLNNILVDGFSLNKKLDNILIKSIKLKWNYEKDSLNNYILVLSSAINSSVTRLQSQVINPIQSRINQNGIEALIGKADNSTEKANKSIKFGRISVYLGLLGVSIGLIPLAIEFFKEEEPKEISNEEIVEKISNHSLETESSIQELSALIENLNLELVSVEEDIDSIYIKLNLKR